MKVCFIKKYFVEGLSTGQIAHQYSCYKNAIRDNLVRFGIERRVLGKHHGNVPVLKYGMKKVNGQVMPHLQEHCVVSVIREMRSKKLSYEQIARILTQMGVSTKYGNKKWHMETVRRIVNEVKDKTEK